MRYARKKLHNEVDCEDAVQSTFEIAYKSLKTLKHNENFKTWITSILKNECYRICKNGARKEENLEDVIIYSENLDSVDSAINFKNMICKLKDEDEKIYNLYFEDRLTTKQIAILLDMNENTVKSRLKRGHQTLRNKIKRSTFILILCILITTGIIAACVISYVKSLFALNSVGKDNEGVLMAIENLEWFQETNMNYISLGDGNKIRMDYLLMDEMNLYMVFDFESEKDISQFTDIALTDLKIENEYGDLICDEGNVLAPQYKKTIGNKLIESTPNSMKFLVYMYTDSFPLSKTLNIEFSKITIAKKLENKEIINTNTNFRIDLAEKFKNRKYINFSSNNFNIKKAILTETGFYCIAEFSRNINIKDIRLFDSNNVSFDCYFTRLTLLDSSSTMQYIIISNFNNADSDTLRLLVNNYDYLLNISL